MTITKGDKVYCVLEKMDCWILSRKIDGLTIEYRIPKDICADEDALHEYVEAEHLF